MRIAFFTIVGDEYYYPVGTTIMINLIMVEIETEQEWNLGDVEDTYTWLSINYFINQEYTYQFYYKRIKDKMDEL